MNVDRTWPEKWVDEVHRDKTRLMVSNGEGKKGTIELGRIIWPDDPRQLTARVGVPLPATADGLWSTRYAQDVNRALSAAAGIPSAPPDDQLGIRIPSHMTEFENRRAMSVLHTLRVTILHAWHVMHWTEGGGRVYLLNDQTALALMHTKIEDLPADLIRLPVGSFYLRIPPELNWFVALEPLATDPEPVQPLDGILVTGEFKDDELISIQLVVAGRSVTVPPGPENLHWFKLRIKGCKTIGDVIHQAEAGGWKQDSSLPEDMRFFRTHVPLRLLLGTLLYLTSTHPRIEVLPSLERPKGMPSTPKHVKKWKKYLSHTRGHVVYVGGSLDVIGKDEHEEAPAEGITRQPPRPHLRSGHWRHSWVGQKDSGDVHRELRWLKPVAVGSWDRVLAWKQASDQMLTTRMIRTAKEKERVDQPVGSAVPLIGTAVRPHSDQSGDGQEVEVDLPIPVVASPESDERAATPAVGVAVTLGSIEGDVEPGSDPGTQTTESGDNGAMSDLVTYSKTGPDEYTLSVGKKEVAKAVKQVKRVKETDARGREREKSATRFVLTALTPKVAQLLHIDMPVPPETSTSFLTMAALKLNVVTKLAGQTLE